MAFQLDNDAEQRFLRFELDVDGALKEKQHNDCNLIVQLLLINYYYSYINHDYNGRIKKMDLSFNFH